MDEGSERGGIVYKEDEVDPAGQFRVKVAEVETELERLTVVEKGLVGEETEGGKEEEGRAEARPSPVEVDSS